MYGDIRSLAHITAGFTVLPALPSIINTPLFTLFTASMRIFGEVAEQSLVANYNILTFMQSTLLPTSIYDDYLIAGKLNIGSCRWLVEEMIMLKEGVRWRRGSRTSFQLIRHTNRNCNRTGDRKFSLTSFPSTVSA